MKIVEQQQDNELFSVILFSSNINMTVVMLTRHLQYIFICHIVFCDQDVMWWFQTGTASVWVWFCLEEERIVRIGLQYSSFQQSQRYTMFHHRMQEVILTASIEFVDPQDVSGGQSLSLSNFHTSVWNWSDCLPSILDCESSSTEGNLNSDL